MEDRINNKLKRNLNILPMSTSESLELGLYKFNTDRYSILVFLWVINEDERYRFLRMDNSFRRRSSYREWKVNRSKLISIKPVLLDFQWFIWNSNRSSI